MSTCFVGHTEIVAALRAARFPPHSKLWGTQRDFSWSHPALQASFIQELIRTRKRYAVQLGQYVNRALQLRLDADYRLKGVSQRQATQAVRWAQEFVSAVTEETTYGSDSPGVH
jgi:hypothetical protein